VGDVIVTAPSGNVDDGCGVDVVDESGNWAYEIFAKVLGTSIIIKEEKAITSITDIPL
jgi:hypothetical protein